MSYRGLEATQGVNEIIVHNLKGACLKFGAY